MPLEALATSGEQDEASRRHAEYFVELAEMAGPLLEGASQLLWIERLVDEHANLRGALRFSRDIGEPDLGLRTAGPIWRFYQQRGHMPEAREWLELLLRLDGATEEARAAGIDGLAGIAYWQSDYAEAERLYRELLELYRELGDEVRVADTLFALSVTMAWLGDLEQGLSLAEEARTAYAAAGAPQGVARVGAAIAFGTWQAGHLEKAFGLWIEARANYAALGDDHEVRQTDLALAAVLHQMGRTDEAVRLVGSTLEAMNDAEDVSGMIMAVDFLASITAEKTPQGALRLAGAAHHHRSELSGGLSADSVGLEPVRSVAAATMEEAFIDEAWSQGEAMSLEETFDLARGIAGAGAAH